MMGRRPAARAWPEQPSWAFLTLHPPPFGYASNVPRAQDDAVHIAVTSRLAPLSVNALQRHLRRIHKQHPSQINGFPYHPPCGARRGGRPLVQRLVSSASLSPHSPNASVVFSTTSKDDVRRQHQHKGRHRGAWE